MRTITLALAAIIAVIAVLAVVAMGLVGGLSQYVHEQTGLNTVAIPPIAGGILLLAILVLHKRGWLRSVGPQDDSLTTERDRRPAVGGRLAADEPSYRFPIFHI